MRRWYVRNGFYPTAAHGVVQRYRCRCCRRTTSAQSESLHYYAKRRLPLQAVWRTLLAGASQREVAWRYGVSPMAVQNAVLRLGRQAMAAQVQLLSQLSPRAGVVLDGLRSSVTGGDYPCDITTVVDPAGEVVLAMEHTVFRRGGRLTARQRRRVAAKYLGWTPQAGTMSRDISRVVGELWDYLRPAPAEEDASAWGQALVIDTDEHPLYRSALAHDPVARHLSACGRLTHHRTPSGAPRTPANRLFAVNYIDRLLRHRVKEHTRETIAGGAHAVVQMHRAWMFAFDTNCMRPWRVRVPERGAHAEQEAVSAETVRWLGAEFFTRRRRLSAAVAVPETMRRVWEGRLPSPPVRWRQRAQKGSSVRIPGFALADLAEAQHQGR
jgi:hypothetical protein